MALMDSADLAAVYRWANLLPTRAERCFAFTHLAWLRNSCVGYPPERGRLTRAKAAELVAYLNAQDLWNTNPTQAQAR